MIEDAEEIVMKAMNLGAQAAEAFMMSRTFDSSNVERDAVRDISRYDDFGVGIRVVRDRRIGFAFSTSISSAERSIEEALRTSRLMKSKRFDLPLFHPFPRVEKVFDPLVAEMDAEDVVERAVLMIEGVKSVDEEINVVEGGVGRFVERIAIVNSEGLAGEHVVTRISGNIVASYRIDPPVTGFSHRLSTVDDIDFLEIGVDAGEMAKKGLNPVRCPDVRDVVLAHSALTQILEFTLLPSLKGNTALKGNSVLSRRLGTEIASDALTISDDQLLPKGPNTAPFDDEGIPSRSLNLIRKGVLNNYIFDLSSGSEFDTPSTSNALRHSRWSSARSYRSPPSVSVRNLVIEPGMPFNRMIDEIDHGVIVYEVMGAHTANPASGDFSVGVNVALEIDHGYLSRGVKPFMMSGDLLSLLKSVIAVADDHRFYGFAFTPASAYVPSIRVEGLNIAT